MELLDRGEAASPRSVLGPVGRSRVFLVVRRKAIISPPPLGSQSSFKRSTKVGKYRQSKKINAYDGLKTRNRTDPSGAS
jgi:hypothetical protein